MTARRPRIAMVLPTVELGQYWKPVLAELDRRTDALRLFTGMPWRGATAEDFHPDGWLESVGQKTRLTSGSGGETDYGGGVMVLSSRIVEAVWRMRPDVVVVSGFSTWTMLILVARPVTRWRVLLLWEGSSPNVDFRNSTLRTMLRRLLTDRADAILTNSVGGREYLTEVVGVPSDRVVQTPYMVPVPVDAVRTSQNQDDDLVNLLSVGRWEGRKGVLDLLETVALLPETIRGRVRLRLVGGGPQEHIIRARAAQPDLAGVVQIVGWVPYDQVPATMASADLLCFLTHEDTWGMVALEAMAVGTPVLCSIRAGVHTYVDEDLRVDPKDWEGTASVLAALLSDPAALRRRRAAVARSMTRHTPADAADRLMEMARRAAAASGQRAP